MKTLSYILMAIAVSLVGYGRYASFDLTEGQALVTYWWVWLLAIAFGAAAYLVGSRE